MSLTALVFVLAFFSGLAAALFRHPIYGLYVYVATFYLHPPSRWWGYDLPDLRWALLSGVVTLAAVLLKSEGRDAAKGGRESGAHGSWLTGPGWILAAFTGWLWLQLAWAVAPSEQYFLAELFAKYLVLLFLMHRLLVGPKEISYFLAAHVAGCLYIGYLVYDLPASSMVQGRLPPMGGPGISSSNYLATQLVTGLLAAVALLLSKSWGLRALAMLSIPFIANGIAQAGSRGGFLGLLAGGCVLYLLSTRGHRWVLVLLGVVGVAVFIGRAPAQFLERMQTIPTTLTAERESGEDGQTRLAIISAQLDMAREAPMGLGHRGTAVLSPLYLDDRHMTTAGSGDDAQRLRASHNTTMTLLAEHGVPGLLLFSILLIWVVRSTLSIRKHLRKVARGPEDELYPLIVILPATLGSLSAVFVAGQFSDFIRLEVIVWCLGLLAACWRICQVQASVPVVEEGMPSGGRLTANTHGSSPVVAGSELRRTVSGRLQ